jgi:hypothetical protein
MSAAVIESFLMFLPVIVTAAYDVPPSARMSASVEVTAISRTPV